ncbi:MAG: glucose-1-phosphate adenylyltransferase subunit GlgD [Proteocatella sp.]
MDALGIIFAYSEAGNLREICEERTMASVSFGGKYRQIDFVLSNFVNSEVFNIAIIAKDNYNSLIEHVGLGKEWDLDRKRGGLKFFTPLASVGSRNGIYRGRVDALACHMNAIKKSIAEYVIISSSSIIYSIDFNEMLEHHQQKNADITMAYTNNIAGCEKVPTGYPLCKFDSDDRLTEMHINKEDSHSFPVSCGIGVFIMKKSLLEALVADAMSYGRFELYTGLIRKQMKTLTIKGYECKKHIICLNTVSGYMKGNLSLLEPEVREQIFENIVYTKVKDSVPVEYGEECSVKNSIIADGCIIEGSVENCVISRGVKIGKGSSVKDSVIMENTTIYANTKLEDVIIDKDVIVREGSEIAGHITFPVVIKKGSII